jgi:hypothetical protein
MQQILFLLTFLTDNEARVLTGMWVGAEEYREKTKLLYRNQWEF